jgi:hypothetical protein
MLELAAADRTSAAVLLFGEEKEWGDPGIILL